MCEHFILSDLTAVKRHTMSIFKISVTHFNGRHNEKTPSAGTEPFASRCVRQVLFSHPPSLFCIPAKARSPGSCPTGLTEAARLPSTWSLTTDMREVIWILRASWLIWKLRTQFICPPAPPTWPQSKNLHLNMCAHTGPDEAVRQGRMTTL